VAGIPKTIDNDIDHIDRTFGFDSAVEAAQVAIRSAKTEAVCNLPNGTNACRTYQQWGDEMHLFVCLFACHVRADSRVATSQALVLSS
jgi:Phosphofructokinase